MKPANGFVTDDGSYFETVPEARRYEIMQQIKAYCDSQQLDEQAVFKIIEELGPTIRSYVDADSQCPPREEVKIAEPSWIDDLDEEIEEARKRKEAIFNSVGETNSIAETNNSADTGSDNELGPFEFERGDSVRIGDTVQEPLQSTDNDPAYATRRARPTKAPVKLALRRPVPLSDLGGDPLPAAVPNKSTGDGS